jgi:hypothetical protein
VAIQIDFEQIVMRALDASNSDIGSVPVFHAKTWSKGSTIVGDSDSARERYRELLIENVDKFANAYLAANPKQH